MRLRHKVSQPVDHAASEQASSIADHEEAAPKVDSRACDFGGVVTQPVMKCRDLRDRCHGEASCEPCRRARRARCAAC